MFRICGAVVLLVITASGLMGQTRRPAMDEARALYYAAEYERALGVLDRVEPANSSEAISVELFRGASLFALGRANEGERAFERLVRLKPDFLPEQLGMTPWITVRFALVRARVLPEIERQNRTQSRRPAVPAVQPDRPEVYTRADASVIPPVPVREYIPEIPVINGAPHSGTVTVFVDVAADGSVERVGLDGTVHPRIDNLIRQAASSWLYRPATLNGRAVKFRKALKVDLH